MFSRHLLLVSIVILSTCSVDCQLPENVALLAGETAELSFTTSASGSFVVWASYISDSKTTMYLNGSAAAGAGPRTSMGMTSDGINITHTLTITGLTLGDGGMYGAEDLTANPVVEAKAEIVVLERSLGCMISPNPVEAGSMVSTTCTGVYQGRWGPVVTCTGLQTQNGTIEDISQPGVVQYNFTAIALTGVPTGSVSCETHFESPTTQEETNLATNIPGYSSQWTSSFDIYYPSTTISISSNLTEYDVGDVITCRATGGNPVPTYKWINSASMTDVSTYNTLVITDRMAGQDFNVTCIATTTINGVGYDIQTDTSFYVTALPTTTTTTTIAPNTTTVEPRKVDERLMVIIIVATVASLLAVVLIIILVICCIKKVSSKTLTMEGV